MDDLTLEIIATEEATLRLSKLLSARGIACHRLPFGLVCSGPRSAWQTLLGDGVAQLSAGAEVPVPPALGDGIEQITVPGSPTYFP